MLHLRHFCYLSYKLFRESREKDEQLPYYAFYVLLYPFVQELNVKTLRKKEKQGFVKKVNLPWQVIYLPWWVNYSRGEHEDEFKASRGRECQRQLATNLPWWVHGELTCHGEQNYSRGELRRPNPSKLTWQKPTGKKSQLAMASKLLAMASS